MEALPLRWRRAEGCDWSWSVSASGCCRPEVCADLGIHQSLYAAHPLPIASIRMYRDNDDQLGVLETNTGSIIAASTSSDCCKAFFRLSSSMFSSFILIGKAFGVWCARGSGMVSLMLMYR